MAVDEAILEFSARGEVPPTLRFYTWQPACLSLGYAQPLADIDLTRLQERGWDLVRRPTGGRAILHNDELTYSVCGPHHEARLAGSVVESYRRLSDALLAGLHLMCLPAETHPEKALPGGNSSGPVCFEVPSNYEIVVQGKKLLGSAQARRKEGVLQHGSLPLFGDLKRIVQVLSYKNEAERADAAARVDMRAVTVESVLGEAIDWQTAAESFTQAFQQVLNIEFQEGELTAGEQERASELMLTKYQNSKWTEKI